MLNLPPFGDGKKNSPMVLFDLKTILQGLTEQFVVTNNPDLDEFEPSTVLESSSHKMCIGFSWRAEGSGCL